MSGSWPQAWMSWSRNSTPGISSTFMTRRPRDWAARCDRPGARRLALSCGTRHIRTSWLGRPGASCCRTSNRPTRTCSRAERSHGTASMNANCGWSRPRSTLLSEESGDGTRGRPGDPGAGGPCRRRWVGGRVRQNGTQGRVDRAAELDQTGPVPDQVPLVVQVSRWDRLKDPAGVLRVHGARPASGRAPVAHGAVGRGGGR